MANEDIRWIQRFNNYRKALARLGKAVAITEKRDLSDLEQQGLIQGFEFTFDLAWKTLQDYLRHHNRPNDNGGPNVIIKQALEDGIIKNKEAWKEMKKSRDLTSHTYDSETTDDIAENILDSYYDLFIQLETRLQLEKIKEEKNLSNQDDTA
ncbi:nucleotidyltransferase substrate binding protein [Pinibacter aurantiacus]|uniref:Nucleotidyltransferase substrate binding protein n=1 Tax=Pinibacter aurantiacus TaxID=2851599 RepID=A0A9E2S8Q7_9BACT|nr:nucleotidyltransferase substrate binding protein [Pinibacter aurantiacus]MBV4356759.1 nucleotidyltransferase substrate binding protein [Pinibacter aurantiacus]